MNFDVKYAPNLYPLDDSIIPDIKPVGDIIDVGCFSAIRILKNLGEQAIAAIYVANKMGKKLRFHINHTVFEKPAGGVVKSLEHMFLATGKHELHQHTWANLPEFKELIKQMDVGMQVSFSETWNLVASDFVSCGIPIIGSKEIEFLSSQYQAEPTDFEDIVEKLDFALRYKWLGYQAINELMLRKKVKENIKCWFDFLNYKD
jgi:hypothetical protein